jgi:FecR protein
MGAAMSADRMRERLRELGRAADPGPEPALDARLAEHVRQHGPALVRRSRQRRAALRPAALVLPLAVGLFAWRALEAGELGTDGSGREAAARASEARLERGGLVSRLEGSAGDGVTPDGTARAEREAHALAATGMTCAQHPVPHAAVATLASGRRSLELGARGRAVLERGADVQLDASDPCRLALQLVRGRVTVHANDLMGGELRVRAASTEVVVHGTTFAVERVVDDVSVEVAEGAVAVEREGRAVAPLVRTGQRLQLSAKHAPVFAALTDAAATQLRAAVAEKLASSTSSTSSTRGAMRVVADARLRSHAARVSESADDESSAPDQTQAVGRDAWNRALAGSDPRGSRELAQAKPERSELSRPITSTSGVDDDLTAPQPSAASREAASTPNDPATTRPTPSTASPDSTRTETAADLVARADRMWRSGSRDDARALYRRAGTLTGATAQAAWLALARRELSIGRSSAARAALDSYKARFPSGALSEEAAGIEFRIALNEHDDALAARLAQQLAERYPSSPAAQAAARWLRARGQTP